METVKMSNTLPVKTKMPERAVSSEPVSSKDTFQKLLQEKKEVADTGTSQVKETDDQTVRAGDAGEVSETPEKGSEKHREEETENLPGEEVLVQASLQQAVIQMTGIITEDRQQTVQEVFVQPADSQNAVLPEDTGTQPAAVQSDDQPAAALEADQSAVRTVLQGQTDESVQAKKTAEPVSREKESGSQEASLEKGETRDMDSAQPVQEISHEEKAQERPAGSGSQTAVQTGQESRKSGTKQEKAEEPVRESLQESVRETAYAPQTVGEKSGERIFADRQTDTIPLKTAESQLPQDLGKTLAARLPGSGRELVVELEPASLGKLTIKLTYDGDRAAVSILASNPRTLELLSQKASEIASILEEKTGQETIIYTQAPEKENQDPEQNPDNRGSQQEQEQRHDGGRNRQESRHETESFAQQLRLGLV